MLLVETRLGLSEIHGIGVFLTQPVQKGQVIWQFDTRIDRVYSQEDVEALPPLQSKLIDTYATWHKGLKMWMLCGDNARHFNHSEAPNTVSDGIAFGTDVAAYDLEAGVELTSDYRTICDHMRDAGGFAQLTWLKGVPHL